MKPSAGHKAPENLFDNRFFLFHQNSRYSRRKAKKLKDVFTCDLKWSTPIKIFILFTCDLYLRMTSDEIGTDLTCMFLSRYLLKAASQMSLVVRKPVFGVSDQLRPNRAVQRQKTARGLKFRIYNVEELYFLAYLMKKYK